jgi:hypothetical protein
VSILQNLLEKGYLPRELPPPFNSGVFALHAGAIMPSWKASDWTESATHNLARPGGLRRPLRIPNPFSYFQLADTVANNWLSIKQHTWKERLSASRPHLMKISPRAVVPRYKFGELPRLRSLRRRGSRYLLKADLSQFYPSLYTHSIPWALHSKAVCKALLMKGAKGKNLFGNELDKALRCLNQGQTHGIPIGPDTSLVLAEALMAAVDSELISRCGKLSGFRYVDDYELSFRKLTEAESTLTELQEILNHYELALNPRKTLTSELPLPLEDSWSVELGRFTVRDAGSATGQRNDLLALFSRAFEIGSERPEAAVMKYTIARVQKLGVASSAWRTFHNCLLGATNADASALPVALGSLYQASTASGHVVFKSPLAELFENLIERHARRGQGSEVSWALWGALAWKINLSTEAAKSVTSMEDNVVALLALDADSRGLFPSGSLDKQPWQDLVADPGVLHQRHWLLAYEANQHNWLSCPAVASVPAFKAMSAAGVRFYDPSKNVPQFPAAATGNPGGSLTNFYA